MATDAELMSESTLWLFTVRERAKIRERKEGHVKMPEVDDRAIHQIFPAVSHFQAPGHYASVPCSWAESQGQFCPRS